jgi:hypothetical protein
MMGHQIKEDDMTEYAYKIVGPIKLSERESAGLMAVSNGRVLSMAFGPGILRLNVEDSPWVVPLLVSARGLNADPKDGLLVWGASEA